MSAAETRLLGALLLDNEQHRHVLGHTTGDEFLSVQLGDAFDAIMAALERGDRLDVVTVSELIEAKEIRGLGVADPFTWTDADLYPADAPVYADLVRADHLRRRGMELLAETRGGLTDAGVDPASALSALNLGLADLLEHAVTVRSEAKVLREVLQGEDHYDWTIPGLLERGDRLIVTGGEGGGKTTLLRQLAVAAAAGVHPFVQAGPERLIPPQRVLVVDAENSERQWRRTSRWLLNAVLSIGGRPDTAERVHIANVKRIDVTKGADLSAIHRLIDEHEPDLLMIGPLYRLYPKAINTDDDAAPVLAALDQLRDRGLTLVMEAHAGKSTDIDGDRNMAPRGSSALLGWPEFGFGIRATRTDPDFSELVKWRGDRDARDWPTHLVRNGGALPWTATTI